MSFKASLSNTSVAYAGREKPLPLPHEGPEKRKKGEKEGGNEKKKEK